MADVPHVVFAMHDPVVYSQETIEANPYVRRHLKTYLGDVLAEESMSLFRRYAPRALEYILAGGRPAQDGFRIGAPIKDEV
ncbi:hypothetical protein LIP_0958 [Limnochorda pilosa]|uniref:Uncharacterized protein n=2 Tax=Limnochorda pilosa TaxID=1555112 RepID=A0A0K2SIA3_LIMPI|nr:hypothetical protein LIP_0958 [Limnochorda pilosa]